MRRSSRLQEALEKEKEKSMSNLMNLHGQLWHMIRDEEDLDETFEAFEQRALDALFSEPRCARPPPKKSERPAEEVVHASVKRSKRAATAPDPALAPAPEEAPLAESLAEAPASAARPKRGAKRGVEPAPETAPEPASSARSSRARR